MMQFLKSILLTGSSKKNDKTVEDLQTKLADTVSRIDILENRLDSANKALIDLTQYVKDVALTTQYLTNEMVGVTQILQDAADIQRKDNDYLSWKTPDDDDGYLN